MRYFLAAVEAVCRYMMATMGFPGHRVNRGSGRCQRIVRASLAPARAGSFAFLDCHVASIIDKSLQFEQPVVGVTHVTLLVPLLRRAGSQ